VFARGLSLGRWMVSGPLTERSRSSLWGGDILAKCSRCALVPLSILTPLVPLWLPDPALVLASSSYERTVVFGTLHPD
jgi:hypothetical protein